MEASVAALNVSRSQNNYNTASHKGLQSYYSLPASNDPHTDPHTDPPTNRPASEPLPSPTSETLSKTIKAEPRSKLQDDSEQRTVQVHAKKPSLQDVSGLKPSGSSIHRSTSQLTQPTTSAIVTGSSDDKLLPKQRKRLSARAQQDQGQPQPAIKEDIGSTTPRAASEPPPSALPATELYSGSAEFTPLMVPKSRIVPDQTPDSGGPTTDNKSSSEGTSKPRRGAIDNDDPMFLHPRKLGHLIEPFLDEDEGRQTSADPNTEAAVVVEFQRLIMEENRETDAAVEHRKRLADHSVKPTAKAPGSTIAKVVGEVLHVNDVPDPATAAPATSKHLAPIARTPEPRRPEAAQPKKYPPATLAEREGMQASEIKTILESHGMSLRDGLGRSQLLYVLEHAFPVSGEPGRVLFYDDLRNEFPGWETRLSRRGEIYYYDTVNKISSWNDLRVTKSNASVEPRSDPAPLPQKISEPQIPSRPRPLETTKSHPANLPGGWAAEPVTFNDGRMDGW
jgi:hypothetical protein